MGSFFTNLQVVAGAGGVDAVRAVLEADAKAMGLLPLAPGEKADRSIVLVAGGRWVSIFDEASDAQDQTVLDRVGKALSKVGPAFSVLIHDSDVLQLTLFGDGKKVDFYDSNPSYFGGKGKRKKPEVHVAAWRHLAPDAEPKLHNVFAAEDLFAEAALSVLGDAVGLDRQRLQNGYRYLAEQPLAGAVVLGWRLAERPAWDKPASGPPRLETQWEQATRIWGTKMPAGAVPRDNEVAVGGDLRLSLTTLNAGGPGKGVVVEVTASDLVEIHKGQLVLGNPKAAKWLEQPFVREGDRLVARFPDAAVPPGLEAGPVIPDAAGAMKALEARFASQVHVNVVGKGATAGRTTVSVRMTPNGGTGTGETSSVVVKSTADRPLRAPAGIHPMMLAPLADRTRMVALVVLRPDAVARAGDVVAAIKPYVPVEGKVRTTIYPAPFAGGALGTVAALMQMASGGGKPKLTTGGAKGFLDGKRWTVLQDAVAAGTGLVHAEWVADAESMTHGADVAVGSGIIPPPDAVPALALGIKDPGDGAESALVAAIDALARDGVLIQALVTRWAHIGVDSTPYELACGIHGQCTLHRPWATRWLRGVGPGWLWLGPELRTHVDATALGTPVGETLRIEVRDVHAVENALAALLPDTKDWTAGMARRYGR